MLLLITPQQNRDCRDICEYQRTLRLKAFSLWSPAWRAKQGHQHSEGHQDCECLFSIRAVNPSTSAPRPVTRSIAQPRAIRA